MTAPKSFNLCDMIIKKKKKFYCEKGCTNKSPLRWQKGMREKAGRRRGSWRDVERGKAGQRALCRLQWARTVLTKGTGGRVSGSSLWGSLAPGQRGLLQPLVELLWVDPYFRKRWLDKPSGISPIHSSTTTSVESLKRMCSNLSRF